MGIDIYMRWPEMTRFERNAQYTGYNIDAGELGYLREAYHGNPYATKTLVPEAFSNTEDDGSEHDCKNAGCPDGGCDGVTIPAALLRRRLPKTLEIAVKRARLVYSETGVTIESVGPRAFARFVELAERKEAELGHPIRVYASY